MGDPLEVYRRKRDFARTPEPAGEGAGGVGGPLRFVVQRHRASRLHYDLRFEIDGVLVSWAVPKGPTLDPDARRLAMHVEDHPFEYLLFEGVIPSGEYGGGDVIVWDTGTWEPTKTDDPRAAIEGGELHAEVHGKKLRGRLVLLRRGGDQGENAWMLLHKHDDFAASGWDPEDHPRSVLSGRTNDEVKADPHFLWRSDAPAAEAAVSLLPEPLPDQAIDDLMALGKRGTWEVFGRSLKVTGLDKVLFPGDPPVTKRELLAYTARIAPIALPYVEGRTFADDPAALVEAANLGAREWAVPISRADAPREPTYALIDLEPGDRTSWDDLLTLARLHRTALGHLGVTARPKVTGRRGIQIWVPVVAGYSFDDTRTWVETLSETVGQVVPELVSAKADVKQRKGLVRLDGTQNAIDKTLLAPYSPRPDFGAPVSVPLGWDELDDPDLRPGGWTIRTVLDRLEEKGDPFRVLLGAAQELPEIT
ncbi:DNA polymerase ligase N-terminal domain-containing protein [Mumia sp. ZJ430]|uniref:non-homologous end-joining DNA ligase LigD n=1 Tax=Mumia sp. ZJ430 TaxID=2708083 RepID=UPI00141E4ED5|nr:DNA polymerase ligase N-terminal domain-containing protein [Mumia sp. ZJ430]